MGQYYRLLCPQTATHVDAMRMGSLVKAWEQCHSTSMPAVLAFLLSAGRGTHPRDLPWTPEGDWAGRMVLMVGDYASELGDLANPAQVPQVAEHELRGRCVLKQQRLGMPPARRKSLRDLSSALQPIFERTHSCRVSNLGWDGTILRNADRCADHFPVYRKPNGTWALDLSYAPVAEQDKERAFYMRCGCDVHDNWRRAPISSFTHAFEPQAPVPDEIPKDGLGDKMLWVNLDRLEFIDPETVGDTPDLAGIMIGDSPRAVLAMITHFQIRGGGDFDPAGPLHIAGRWRGDRIVLMGTKGFKGLTQEQVRQSHLDVSGNALAFVKSEEFFGSDDFNEIGEKRLEPTQIEKEAIKCAMADPALAAYRSDPEAIARLAFRIKPRAVITKAPRCATFTGPLELAPTFDVHEIMGDTIGTNRKIRLSGATCRQIAALLCQEKPVVVKATPTSRLPVIDVSDMLEKTARSRHDILAGLAA